MIAQTTNIQVPNSTCSNSELETKRFLDASMAKFVELLRWKNDSILETWSGELLQNLIPYVNGIQGAFYYAQEDDLLFFLSGYACPQDVHYVVRKTEGLTGQAATYKQAIYLEDIAVPRSNSGLADISAKVLLIQPLVYNGFVEGVIEIAALKPFSVNERKLIDELSAIIAAHLHTIRNQTRVLNLLYEAQEKNNELEQKELYFANNINELQTKVNQLSALNEKLTKTNTEILATKQDEIETLKIELFKQKNETEKRKMREHKLEKQLMQALHEIARISAQPKLEHDYSEERKPYEQKMHYDRVITNSEFVNLFLENEKDLYHLKPIYIEPGNYFLNNLTSSLQ